MSQQVCSYNAIKLPELVCLNVDLQPLINSTLGAQSYRSMKLDKLHSLQITENSSEDLLTDT